MNYKSAATFRQLDVWGALFEDLLAGFLFSFTREKTATLEMPCSFLLIVSKFWVFCMVTGYRLVYIWSKIQYLSMFTHIYPSTTQSWDLMEQLGQTTAQSRNWKQDLWILRPRVMLYHTGLKASSIAKLYKWPLIHYIFLFNCFQFLSLSPHKKIYICLHNNSIVVGISVLISLSLSLSLSLSQIAHICYLILMMINILQCQVNYIRDPI